MEAPLASLNQLTTGGLQPSSIHPQPSPRLLGGVVGMAAVCVHCALTAAALSRRAVPLPGWPAAVCECVSTGVCMSLSLSLHVGYHPTWTYILLHVPMYTYSQHVHTSTVRHTGCSCPRSHSRLPLCNPHLTSSMDINHRSLSIPARLRPSSSQRCNQCLRQLLLRCKENVGRLGEWSLGATSISPG